VRVEDNNYIVAVTRLLLHLHGWVVPALTRPGRKSGKVGRRILRKAIEQLPLLIMHHSTTSQ